MYKKALLLLFPLFFSCSTDLDLTAEWKEITIVYGLLNPTDSAHYVKISKAFLDESTDALTIAQRGDSLFHQQALVVALEEWKDGSKLATYPLSKVDGVDEGFTKEPGTFAASPNILFKTKAPLNTAIGYTYLLTISNTHDGKDLKAETPIVGKISNLLPNKIIPLNWASKGDYNFSWRSAENGKIYDLTVRIHWTEFDVNTGLPLDTGYWDWAVVRSLKSESTDGGVGMSYKVPAKNLYYFVRTQLTPDPDVYRVVDSFGLYFYVGEAQLSTYIDVVNAQLGLTQTQIKPAYTNVENGLGIFSSRYDTVITGIPFTNAALDSFGCGTITGHLNFAPSKSHPNWPFCQ